MARHIGIVGCSAEGAALCYQTICREGAALMGEHSHPEVSMHTYPLNRYMDYIYQDNWKSVVKLMISSAREVINEAIRQGFKQLAVLGTRYLMTGPVYKEACKKTGLKMRVPTKSVRDRIDSIIFKELVYGDIREESPLPLLDSTRILARAALSYALKK